MEHRANLKRVSFAVLLIVPLYLLPEACALFFLRFFEALAIVQLAIDAYEHSKKQI